MGEWVDGGWVKILILCYYICIMTSQNNIDNHYDNIKGNTLRLLKERIKELTALHRAASILNDIVSSKETVIYRFINTILLAWQYPENTQISVQYGNSFYSTDGFRDSKYNQKASFKTQSGTTGQITVVLINKTVNRDKLSFLKEEQELIISLSSMLESFFERRELIENLENIVSERTCELEKKTDELKKALDLLSNKQELLSKMSLQLTMAEEKEKRSIAINLHDHLGQALAMMKQKLIILQGDIVFSGYEESLEDPLYMLDQIITYTRDLTFDISPPVLYELGLLPALDWLSEQINKKGIKCKVSINCSPENMDQEIKILIFRSIREILNNTVKHSNADETHIVLDYCGDNINITVEDNGKGFNIDGWEKRSLTNKCFGLLSIQERLSCLGGKLGIHSEIDSGTKITLSLPIRSSD